MKTAKGPAIFLAQFAGDTAPYNSLKSIAKWAAGLGYVGIQIPSWDGRLFDLAKAAESKTYADEAKTRFQSSFAEANERAKAALEKSSKAFEELGELTRGNLEAVVESSKIAAKGVETLDQLREALAAGATMILLDNMDARTMREAVGIAGDRAELEASGGITLENVRAVAETGVHRISIGGLTKDVKAVDFSMRFEG